MSAPEDLRPQAVLITGAAGMIGSATAHEFEQRGWTVVGLDKSPEAKWPGSVVPYIVDVTDERAVTQALDDASKQYRLMHLVGIAGGALPGDDDDASGKELPTPDVFRSSVELNLTAQYLVLYALAPLLRAGSGNRSVTFCSSINALSAWARPSYSAAKAGLLGLTGILADTFGADGVRVNCVAPGSVGRPKGPVGRSSDPDLVAELTASIPLGQAASPEDVARCFAALALDLTHINGQTIVVDGGQEVRRRRR
ncbi:SDR family oxidoreductase [Yinghuangia sp. ASG 101]|uniref:SDR family NAD(P)-dependent oxidoreductase n=1 Tax=Yinghuangia sp. ASG 101 TaxID=2896848 RepID=UPI001E5087B4|nr:SDR family oxidoreductase [Yinghuangia sp. ASG 101]UGQ11460.1 SDR family oxidoreductase [Yinghuangia sp. ASG 101]